MTAVSVQLPEEVVARLNVLASRSGRSTESYVADAVLEHLDDLDDVALAEQRLEEIRAGRSEPIPLEDVMKRYGMED
jgi:RHH-type transcriptional regulator, rel operon repressor / antitoxin RelB